MSKPRTPEYFPLMKVRGARRRRLAPFQRATGAFKRLTVSAEATRTAFMDLAKMVNPTNDRT